MNKIVFLLVAFLIHGASYAGAPARSADVKLRYDGVYRTQVQNPGNPGGAPDWHYLRFYPGGWVNAATMSGRLEEVQAWFSRDDRKHLSNSSVEIRGNRMTYSNFQPDGAVDYAGRISGNRLDLDVYYHTNRRRVKAIYRFVKLHDQARDCRSPEPEGELFRVFFARFAHDRAFAISRTKPAILEDFDPKQASPQITTLDVYMEESGLVAEIRAVNSQAEVVVISGPNANSHFAYRFWREERCWILVGTEELHYKPW